MTSGTNIKQQPDPLTAWELAAINLLIALDPKKDIDVKASRENMLALMQALDRNELEPFLKDPGFMKTTETLLLAMLKGEKIDVADPTTFAARKEIFAAAQVIYNQAIARGHWQIHPKIIEAMARDS
jgi:hypothetical protein